MFIMGEAIWVWPPATVSTPFRLTLDSGW